MDDGVLKEFLVKLGFKVDEPSHKKMDGAVKEVTKSINALGLATDITLAALTALTVKASESLDKLYFASQRTGSAVTDIKAMGYGVASLGGSADAAQASIENLSHFMRSYPGADNFLEKLGVKPENIKNSEKAMEDLATTFRGMPFWQAQPYANMLGIDEKTLIAMQSGEYEKKLQEYRDRLKEVGVNEDEAAAAGNRLQQAIRTMAVDAGIAGEAMTVGPFGKFLLWCVDALDRIAVDMTYIFKDPVQAIKNAHWDPVMPRKEPTAGPDLGYEQVTPDMLNSALGKSTTGSAWKKVTDYFVSQGWTPAQAAGIAANLQNESGLDPTAKNSNGMYGLAQWDTTRRDAFKQWSGRDIHGSSMDDQLAFIQHELMTSEARTGNALKAANTPFDAGYGFNNNYERNGSLEQARLRGDIASKSMGDVKVENTFHIKSTDPQGAASEVAARQNDVHNTMTRNIQGAVR